MKKILIKLTFLFLGITISQLLYAQNKSKLSGTLIDSATLSPIPFGTLKLFNAQKDVVKVAASNEKGEFLINDIPLGNFTLNIISLDHELKVLNLNFESSVITLGLVSLKSKSTVIKEVEFVAQKKIVTKDADKLVYDIQADPESKSLDALTIMNKVPYLSVDGNDQLQLKGKTEFKIFVNGRPSSMMERDYKNILKSMPSANISKIEVITNPSSKYDAEGIDGIINIVTNKRVLDGYSGNLSSGTSFPNGTPRLGLSITTKNSKFGFSANGSYSYNNSPYISSFNTLSNRVNQQTLNQNGLSKSSSKNGYIYTEVSYELDSLQLFTASLSWNKNAGTNNNEQLSVLNDQQNILQRYLLLNDGTTKGHGNDFSVNYQLGFKNNKKKLLTFSYNYYDYANSLNSYQNLSQVINFNQPNYRQTNLGTVDSHTAQLDFIQPINKLNFEAGVKATYRANKGDYVYDYFDINIQNYLIDASRTNIYTNDQLILGAYNSLSYKFKKVSLRGGLRLENTIENAEFISTKTHVKQNYWSLLPNIGVSINLTDNKSLSTNFTQRINRAGINKLNPFVDRSNPNFEKAGNPNLYAPRVNTLNLEYSYFNKLNASVGLQFNQAKGMFIPVDTFDPVTQITRSTFENMGKMKGIGLNYYLSFSITKKWNFSSNGGGEYIDVNTQVGGKFENIDIYMGRFNLNTAYSIKSNWRVNASFNFNSATPNTLQSRNVSYSASSFGSSIDLAKNKISLSASVNNPFNKYRDNYSEINNQQVFQINSQQIYFRRVNFSANYKFGQLKGGIKKNQRNIRNDDFSN